MNDKVLPVQQSSDVLGGLLVFAGTRVPVQTLIDYLAAGDTIDNFLDDFPTVTRQQVIDVLKLTEAALSSTVNARSD
ncbi:MAG: DUF433 domain-containing protein [Chloroflexi bacterium]|nr:DUF433 domain-containing protein [Chloroflexota bacterium]